MIELIRDASPRFKARLAGGLYLFSLLAAMFLELFLGGRLGFAADVIQMTGMLAVTLLLYSIFRPVSRSISLLAASSNLVGLGGIVFEVFRGNPRGENFAMVFHGIFCLLIGYLVFRSNFLPRILGALIAFGGLSWLTYLSPSLASHLSPYNVACGLLGEASLFMWLVVMGVNVERWNEQTTAALGDAPPMKAAVESR
jgi:hypothetical protein